MTSFCSAETFRFTGSDKSGEAAGIATALWPSNITALSVPAIMLPSGPAIPTRTAPSTSTSAPASLVKRRRMRSPAMATRTNWRTVTLAGSPSGVTTTGTLPGLSSSGWFGAAAAGIGTTAARGTVGEGPGVGVMPGGGGVGTKPQAPSQLSWAMPGVAVPRIKAAASAKCRNFMSHSPLLFVGRTLPWARPSRKAGAAEAKKHRLRAKLTENRKKV